MSEQTELDSALPQQPQKRDLLGNFCFYLHFAVMLYIVTGWLVPWNPALGVYLVFIPGVFVQWQVNKDTCILNNIEGWLRTRKWRNKEVNPEEGLAPHVGEERDRAGFHRLPDQSPQLFGSGPRLAPRSRESLRPALRAQRLSDGRIAQVTRAGDAAR